MKFNKKHMVSLAVGVLALVALMEPAMAATNGGTGSAIGADAFDAFQDTVMGWTQGPLGIGLSVTMMLMGAGVGVAKNSPMPALSGLGGAAFLTWGPDIITSMISSGAMLPQVLGVM